ncbi:MAG: ferric reductase-like transmembrane domain-containing protein [archaeon]
MKFKSKLGPAIVILLSFMPLLIWLIVRQGTYGLDGFKTLTYSLGQLTALIGTAMFAVTFVLSTRLKAIENYFNGLDKMYLWHHLLGAISFILILFHPILLLIKYLPENFKLAASYLIPGSQFGYNMGIFALLSMIILLGLTFFATMKYNNWKISHKLMGLVYIMACFHMFNVFTDITLFASLRYYMVLISALGLTAYIYTLFLKPKLADKYEYVIANVQTSKAPITILELTPLKEKIEYLPGQFVFLKINSKHVSNEQHPYSLASSPSKDGKLRLAIKSLGDYTSQLKNVQIGDKVELEGPYGRFNYKQKLNEKQVWIAGGIGITPFLSFAQNLAKNNENNTNVYLYYCVKNKSEAVFLDELNLLSEKNNKIKVIPYYSEIHGKIDADKIEKNSGNLKETSFFLCGPNKMMESLTKQLKTKGVPRRNILFEDFNIK